MTMLCPTSSFYQLTNFSRTWRHTTLTTWRLCEPVVFYTDISATYFRLLKLPLLPPWSRVLIDKPQVFQLVKKFRAFCRN